MKKLISFITVFALMLQLTSFSAVAATPIDKTTFSNISEVYGAYTYDAGNYNIDVVVYTATDFSHFYREMGSTKLKKYLYCVTSSPKYVLSKDKKTVTASYILDLPYYDIKLNCSTTFMKDSNGKVYFNDKYSDGSTYQNYKAYQNIEVCRADIKSSNFAPILKAEFNILNQIDGLEDEVSNLRKAYKDTDAISQTNLLDGYYQTEKNDIGLDFSFNYNYNSVTYDDFMKIYKVTFYYKDNQYTINAPYYTLDGNTASYMKDDHNYIEITATDRHHVTKVKLVVDDQVVVDSSMNLTYSVNQEQI